MSTAENNFSTLLNKLYQTDPDVQALEKTAESQLFQSLQDDGHVEENPYAEYSTQQLIELAQGLMDPEAEKVAAAEVEEEVPELLEKTAADMIGGQIMAHSMVHEFGLMKEAMLRGDCRVCKEFPMDVDGSSVCSTCLSSSDQAA